MGEQANHSEFLNEYEQFESEGLGFGEKQDLQSQFEMAENSIAQSSVMESELEFTGNGNVRASTYKRNEETEKHRAQKRKQLKYFKSEERTQRTTAFGGNNFFTKDYLDNRYVNDRVEMELNDFKKEIEEKYESSGLRDYKFIRKQSPKKAAPAIA